MNPAGAETTRDRPRVSGQVVFILSDMRSGSTLLDQLLGAHSEILSVGELHWLAALAARDRSIYDPEHGLVCSCGLAVLDCPFWTRVQHHLGRPLASLALRDEPSALKRRMRERAPTLLRHPGLDRLLIGRNVLRDSLELGDSLCEVSCRRFIVDSSKTPFRFRSIYNARPDRTLAVVLVRDYRAVVHSKMKRGHSLESAATGWRIRMEHIATLTTDLPRQHVHGLTYESLCRDPAFELRRICAFLGLDFEPAMLERRVIGSHHIGGSPTKFDTSRIAIRQDLAYKAAFTPSQLATLAAIAGAQAARWGY